MFDLSTGTQTMHELSTGTQTMFDISTGTQCLNNQRYKLLPCSHLHQQCCIVWCFILLHLFSGQVVPFLQEYKPCLTFLQEHKPCMSFLQEHKQCLTF